MTSLRVHTRQLYGQIRQDVVSLHYRWSIFLKLFETGETTDLLYQAAPCLFRRVLFHDMLDAMVLDLARLFDPAKQGKHLNASLEQLINEVQPIDSKLARELKTRRDNAIQAIPNLSRWRDKWAAHRDYKTMLAVRTPTLSTHRPKLNPKQVAAVLAELDLFLIAFQSAFHLKQIVNPKARDVVAIIDRPDPYSNFDASDEMAKFLRIIKVGVANVKDQETAP